MKHEELIKQAGMDSGVVHTLDDGSVVCTACGSSAESMDALEHASDCKFLKAMEHIYDGMHAEATIGEVDMADIILQDVIAAVPSDMRARVDAMLDSLAMEDTVEGRLKVLKQLEGICQGMDNNLLVGYATMGISGNAARRRLRALVLYEIYAKNTEKDILFEIARLQQAAGLLTAFRGLDDAR